VISAASVRDCPLAVTRSRRDPTAPTNSFGRLLKCLSAPLGSVLPQLDFAFYPSRQLLSRAPPVIDCDCWRMRLECNRLGNAIVAYERAQRLRQLLDGVVQVIEYAHGSPCQNDSGTGVLANLLKRIFHRTSRCTISVSRHCIQQRRKHPDAYVPFPRACLPLFRVGS
jgi:hypothetical protein